MCHWAESSTFLLHIFRHFTCHEILSIIEDEDKASALFIEPHDDCASDEDSADEDHGGMIDNLTENQLIASAEAVFSDGRRITAAQDEDNSEANIIDRSSKTPE